MSDRVAGSPTLETRMDDIRAVMDAAESERAVIFAAGDSGPTLRPFRGDVPRADRGSLACGMRLRGLRDRRLFRRFHHGVRQRHASTKSAVSLGRAGIPRRSRRPEKQPGCERRRHTLLRTRIPSERESGGGGGLHADESRSRRIRRPADNQGTDADLAPDRVSRLRHPGAALHGRTDSGSTPRRAPRPRLRHIARRSGAAVRRARASRSLAGRPTQPRSRTQLPLKRPTSPAATPRSPCRASPTRRATASSARPRPRRGAIPPSGVRA